MNFHAAQIDANDYEAQHEFNCQRYFIYNDILVKNSSSFFYISIKGSVKEDTNMMLNFNDFTEI